MNGPSITPAIKLLVLRYALEAVRTRSTFVELQKKKKEEKKDSLHVHYKPNFLQSKAELVRGELLCNAYKCYAMDINPISQ